MSRLLKKWGFTPQKPIRRADKQYFWLNVEAEQFNALNIPDTYSEMMMESLQIVRAGHKGFIFVASKMKNGKKEVLFKYRFPTHDGRIYFTGTQNESRECVLRSLKYIKNIIKVRLL